METTLKSLQEEMNRVGAYFPFRKVSAVLLPDGSFEVFANSTYARANNYAKRVNGTLYRLERSI